MMEDDSDDESQEVSDLSSEDWNNALDRAFAEEENQNQNLRK